MREIRSKNTYQKGKLLKINNDSVLVSFVKELEPIKLSFDSFLQNCFCEKDVEELIIKKKQKLEEEIEKSHTLHNISL